MHAALNVKCMCVVGREGGGRRECPFKCDVPRQGYWHWYVSNVKPTRPSVYSTHPRHIGLLGVYTAEFLCTSISSGAFHHWDVTRWIYPWGITWGCAEIWLTDRGSFCCCLRQWDWAEFPPRARKLGSVKSSRHFISRMTQIPQGLLLRFRDPYEHPGLHRYIMVACYENVAHWCVYYIM